MQKQKASQRKLLQEDATFFCNHVLNRVLKKEEIIIMNLSIVAIIFIFESMKFMAFILSITIMALSLMPCKDINAGTAQQSFTISQSNGAHQCGHDDHCSPFCLCSCCATTTASEVVRSTVRLKAPVVIRIKKEYNIRNIPFSSSFLDNIWQPPKDQIAA